MEPARLRLVLSADHSAAGVMDSGSPAGSGWRVEMKGGRGWTPGPLIRPALTRLTFSTLFISALRSTVMDQSARVFLLEEEEEEEETL